MDFSDLIERPVEQHTVFTGIVVNVRQDVAAMPNGKLVKREIIEHPGGVAVLPIDGEGNVLMVRQYRYAFGRVMLEIPAGKLEPGEDADPAAAARRELREETGCLAGVFEPMGRVIPSPGIYRENLWLYFAGDLTYVGEDPDEDELLRLERVPYARARELCLSGEIEDAKTVVAVLRAERFIKQSGNT